MIKINFEVTIADSKEHFKESSSGVPNTMQGILFKIGVIEHLKQKMLEQIKTEVVLVKDETYNGN